MVSDEGSQDKEAYEYLQQEQQYNEDDEMQHPDDQDDEQFEEGQDGQLQFDVDELNEQERQQLIAYLQEEYEKNPDMLQIPKEKLQELINAQLNMR